MRTVLIKLTKSFYRYLLRPVLFHFDPESVHTRMAKLGESLGSSVAARAVLGSVFGRDTPALAQKFHNITFKSPVGLAAGFDYEARLTQILPSLGFGFGSVGTITDGAYGGNPKPRLGRLVRSLSLMVNKGYKNEGIDAVLKKLGYLEFRYPTGLSLGRTNTKKLVTFQESVADIGSAFQKTEKAGLDFAYYELNISCPNLYGNINFYDPGALRFLLKEIFSLPLSKPVFVKMPIEKSDEEIRAMLEVIVAFPVAGVIFGNLQKNRSDPGLDPREVARFPVGNFSGRPTWARSNSLIRLAYREYGKRLIIIGCGGVFSPQDAYAKIRLGASLVQLITGLIFQGPQLVSEINLELPKLLAKDGYGNISEAIGADAK